MKDVPVDAMEFDGMVSHLFIFHGIITVGDGIRHTFPELVTCHDISHADKDSPYYIPHTHDMTPIIDATSDWSW